MGRADEIRARMAGEIAVAEAEDALIAAKAKGTARDKRPSAREARQAYREANPAGGTANPATIETSASVKRAGGK